MLVSYVKRELSRALQPNREAAVAGLFNHDDVTFRGCGGFEECSNCLSISKDQLVAIDIRFNGRTRLEPHRECLAWRAPVLPANSPSRNHVETIPEVEVEVSHVSTGQLNSEQRTDHSNAPLTISITRLGILTLRRPHHLRDQVPRLIWHGGQIE